MRARGRRSCRRLAVSVPDERLLTSIQHDDAPAAVQRLDRTSCDTCETLVDRIAARAQFFQTMARHGGSGNLIWGGGCGLTRVQDRGPGPRWGCGGGVAAEDADNRVRTHHDVGRQELFQIISHEGEATGCRMSDDGEAMSAASWAGISAKIIYWLQVSIEVRSAGEALWLTQTYVSSINRTRSMLPWRRADDLPEGSPPC